MSDTDWIPSERAQKRIDRLVAGYEEQLTSYARRVAAHRDQLAARDAEVGRLTDRWDNWRDEQEVSVQQAIEFRERTTRAEGKVEKLVDALHRIVNWSEAYPLAVFPEPDFKKAAMVLKDNGMTLDAISASNMRHVVTGVGDIARTALRDED